MSLESTLPETTEIPDSRNSEKYLSALHEHPCSYCKDSKKIGQVRLFFGGYVDCPKCDATGIERDSQKSLPISLSELQRIANQYRKILATTSDNQQRLRQLS